MDRRAKGLLLCDGQILSETATALTLALGTANVEDDNAAQMTSAGDGHAAVTDNWVLADRIQQPHHVPFHPVLQARFGHVEYIGISGRHGPDPAEHVGGAQDGNGVSRQTVGSASSGCPSGSKSKQVSASTP